MSTITIVKLQSANMMSPGIRFSKMPHCSVINLSVALPPLAFERKETVPWGVIPISNLKVLWFNNYSTFVTVLQDQTLVSINISVQSSIQMHLP